MKLSNEELKKVFLSTMIFVVLVYGYDNFLLDDLNKSEKGAETTIARLKPEIAKAEDQIHQTTVLKEQAPHEGEALEQIKALIPPGEPVAWFPPRITDFFKRQGIERSSVRPGAVTAINQIPGFKRIEWTIDLPRVEYAKLAIAIAGLENETPLLEINSLSLEQKPDSIEFQHAILSVSIIVKDEKR